MVNKALHNKSMLPRWAEPQGGYFCYLPILNHTDRSEGTLAMCLNSTCVIWQYGLSSFQVGGTKFERCLPKNQHPQRKLLNCCNGEASNFLCQKSLESFSIFFPPLENSTTPITIMNAQPETQILNGL